MISPEIYKEAAVLAETIGRDCLRRLDLMTLQPKVILDLGCGLGECAAHLKKRYENAEIVALDLSMDMLRYGKAHNKADWICADAEILPFKNHSVDLIFANLLLPWCHDLKKLLLECRRVLKPNGLFLFTSLGPNTLLPTLMDMHEVGDRLIEAKFQDPVLDVEKVSLTYRTREKIFSDLQAMGMMLLDDSLSDMVIQKNAEDLFELDFEIIFGSAFAPEITEVFDADEEGVVRIPLSHLRRR